VSSRHESLARARFRFTGRAAVLAALLVGMLVAAAFPVRTYLSQRAQKADLHRQVQTLEIKNRQLARRIHQLHDPAYLERLARECLGMVKPGEVSFVIVPKGGGPQPARC
jgi:cell division protein FtsB